MSNQQLFSRKLVSARIGAPFTFMASLLAIALVFTNSEKATASERITFETPPVQQSAFKIKRAKAKGITLEPTPGIALSAILSTPEGEGPHPAVVLLPESVEARHSYEAWADHLNENGFVTLIVESLISRGETFLKDDQPMNLLVDAQGGLVFLSTLDSVDPKRVGLLGVGMSGWFVQRSLDVNFSRGAENLAFNAGVVIYPHCNPDMKLNAPILVLAGGKDDRISLASCRALIEFNPSEALTKLKVYPKATHFFDNIAYAKEPELHGKDWAEPNLFAENDYDPEARADAEREVLEFFKSVGASN